jgi:hypothetical protein
MRSMRICKKCYCRKVCKNRGKITKKNAKTYWKDMDIDYCKYVIYDIFSAIMGRLEASGKDDLDTMVYKNLDSAELLINTMVSSMSLNVAYGKNTKINDNVPNRSYTYLLGLARCILNTLQD